MMVPALHLWRCILNSSLLPVVGVDESKCVNCHACITACPVKYCIDGSGDKVRVNHDLCIGCGRCLEACSHGARFPIDDSEAFFRDLDSGAGLVVIVAPAAAASFAGRLPRLLGWLRARGVKAVFDASYGAELCVDSYRRILGADFSGTLIAQPCPAIVTYIELYRPELLPSLSPVDSPILHGAKMVRARYPELGSAKIAALTPCLAKRREFAETGTVSYNVTFVSVMANMESRGESLAQFPESGFDGPAAERAAGFPLPGGLIRTLARDAPEAAAKARTIEGPDEVYPYLDHLSESISLGLAPLVLDCLNCAQGCVVGPGGRHRDLPLDLLRKTIAERSGEDEAPARGVAVRARRDKSLRELRASLSKAGAGVDFSRRYVDRSSGARIARPTREELDGIYASMDKRGEADLYDCSACGYGSCEAMAVAIHNGLNKAENCQKYEYALLRKDRERELKLAADLHGRIVEVEGDLDELETTMKGLVDSCSSQAASIEESTAAIESMINSIREASRVSEGRREALAKVVEGARVGGERLSKASSAMSAIMASVSGIGEMSGTIADIADQINLLSMNAAIEAAHAGAAGKGFAVIAGEVKRLAESSARSSSKVAKDLEDIGGAISGASELSLEADSEVIAVMGEVRETSAGVSEVLDLLASTASGSSQLTAALREMRDSTVGMRDAYERIAGDLSDIARAIGGVREASETNLAASEAEKGRSATPTGGAGLSPVGD